MSSSTTGSRRRWCAAMSAVALVAALPLLATGAAASTSGKTPLGPPALVRVNQVGYATGDHKRAFLVTEHAVTGEHFAVLDEHNHAVLSGKVGASLGGWNAQYAAVAPINFTSLTTPGVYHLAVHGAVAATSPTFRIASADALFGQIADDNLSFIGVQRDGDNVIPGVLDRKPAHLTDHRAFVYATPTFKGSGGDVLKAPLTQVGGPIDVEGGWSDAADYLKFVHSASFTDAALQIAIRDEGAPGSALRAEAAHGLTWLGKMWDPSTGVLYAQVGLGTGNPQLHIKGDHDVWRLPEADDALKVKKGGPLYYIKYRPVFRANDPGQLISPNLAGRVAAAFALGAQNAAATNPTLARAYLETAAQIFGKAKTTNVGPLVSAFPDAYYHEDSWADDMEFGATELSLAARALHDTRENAWVVSATHFAKLYVANLQHQAYDYDTLTLYDTSALAHADLIRQLGQHPGLSGVEYGRTQIVADLHRQVGHIATRAAHDMFRSGANVDDFDAVTRTMGFIATEKLYAAVTGDHSFDDFATQQRDWVLGANAWGSSFIVGEGSTYPLCPQHQVANLAGSLTGGTKIIRGAVVNGPNDATQFDGDYGLPPGGKVCGSEAFAPFDTKMSRYVDNVGSWQSDEPSIDFTAGSLLAFTLVSGR